VGFVVVDDVVQDSQHHHGDRFAEVQSPRRLMQNLLDVAYIGVDVVGGALRATYEQSAGVHQHHAVVIDINDAELRSHRLSDLMSFVSCVGRCRCPGTDLGLSKQDTAGAYSFFQDPT
jgi:hypothetical protein